MTSMEREEKEKVKKREKKLEDEETMQQATWVKYTFPIKHQVGCQSQQGTYSLHAFALWREESTGGNVQTPHRKAFGRV